MHHSAHVTRFHFVLPRFVQARPGVYEAGSHLHLMPKKKNGHESIFVLYLSLVEPSHCEQVGNTRNMPQTVTSYSVIWYILVETIHLSCSHRNEKCLLSTL